MFPTKNLVKPMLLANLSVLLFVCILAYFGTNGSAQSNAEDCQKHLGEPIKSTAILTSKEESSAISHSFELNFNLFFNVFNY